MESTVDVVVVSYKCREALLDCCASVTESSDTRLIVVDNASADGSVDAVRSRFPAVTVIERETNDGFATAVNVGVRNGSSRYVLLLNPDARLADGALGALCRVLDEDPEIGAAGPRIESGDGAIELSYGRTLTPANELGFKVAGLLYRQGRGPLASWIRRRYARRRDTRSLTAACLIVRRRTLEELGGLDERFFLYAEDVDLCVRMRRAGWRLVYTPEARVTHTRGTSANVDPAASDRAYRQSQLSFYRKHNGRLATAVLRTWLGARYAARAVTARGAERTEAVAMLRWCLHPDRV